MAAPTSPCDVKILLANSEPSTHGTLLALDVLEIERRLGDLAHLRGGPREHLRALEMIGELDQRLCGDDLHVRARPGGLRPAGERADQTLAVAPIAAGSTPATGAIEPSRPSSPSTVRPAAASCGIAPIAAISPSAIGRS